MSTKIAQLTASIILLLSVFSIVFSGLLELNLTSESFAFLGTITGASVTFLFLAKTKNNGTLVTK